MGLYVTALNSGSNGNCYYIGNEKEAVFIDTGISCRETEKRMHRLGLEMGKVKAIFISHEHSDHVRGTRVIAKKYHLPIYITPGTLANVRLDPKNPSIVLLKPFSTICIDGLKVTAFPKLHDAADPQSFIIEHDEVTVGVFTDIGAPCDHVTKYLGQCNAVFLETNYDETMLLKGRYPIQLKRRVHGEKGHLSNTQALELVQNFGPPQLSHLFLSHISHENNHPDIIENLFRTAFPGKNVVLTSRYNEIPIHEITTISIPET